MNVVHWFTEATRFVNDIREPRPVCLLVEDDNDTRDLVRELLLEHDVDVLDASCGHDAIAACAASRVDVAIIDLGLPTMDGLTLCEAIRAMSNAAHVGAVAYTGFATLTRSARAAGFDAMIIKPFDGPGLVDVVRRGAALGRSRSWAALA